MRVFLSAFSGFTLAVPMNAVAAIMLYDKKPEKIIEYDQKNRNTYISLPRLFNLNEEEIRHGIILREWNSKANKVVLLTAEIKRDIEIPDKEFHPIPKSLGALRFSRIFNGIKFSDNPILLLNIEQLTQLIQEEQQILNDNNYSPKPPLPEQPPLAEEPPPEEQPPAVASEPSPPPPELESQIEQPPSEEPLPEQPPPAVVFEPEPLPDPLVLEDLPPEQPPPTVASELEPLPDPLVLEDLPSEEPPPTVASGSSPPPSESECQIDQPTQIIQEDPQVIIIQEDTQVIQVIEDTQVIEVIGDQNNFTVEPLTELLVLSEELL